MAAKTAKITLGEREYEIRALNIGELERVTELFDEGVDPRKAAFSILRIGMERAVPQPEGGINAIEATSREIASAVEAIMRISGMEPPKENPTTASAPGQPSAAVLQAAE